MLGFDCIGIELNEEYSEIARKRVDAVPESLFDEPTNKKLKKQAEQIAIEMETV
jgi:DNA modification methylase